MINNNCNRFGKFRCKIVLSGGPCAGKTTTITKLAETIYNDKWQIFTVAEAVSLLKMGGVHRSQLNQDQLINWQNDLLLTICQLEDVYDNIAKNEVRNIVFITAQF
jgi:Flp pilus assembly CpaF family ATPase